MLMRFTHLDSGPAWEAFPGQYLDMGIVRVNDRRRFMLKVKNKAGHLMRFSVVPEGCGPLRIPIPDDAGGPGIPSGASCNILVEPHPREAGEHSGRLKIKAETKAGETYELVVPTYMRFIMPENVEKINSEMRRRESIQKEKEQKEQERA